MARFGTEIKQRLNFFVCIIIFVIQSRLETLEHQVERGNALCELLLVEQRRLAASVDQLAASAVSAPPPTPTLPPPPPPPTRWWSAGPAPPPLRLSSLPMHSPWQVTGEWTKEQLHIEEIPNDCNTI